jgi:hypothetical protein
MQTAMASMAALRGIGPIRERVCALSSPLHYCLLLAREGEDARILLSGLETAGLFRYVDRQRIAFQLEDSSLVLGLKNFIPGSIDSGDQFSRRTISGPPATGS